jgi:DNA-binding response OmpR family regulator
MGQPVRNVLSIDDDRGTCELLTTVLSSKGFRVMVAEDGLEGLHVLRTVRHRAPDVPCVVLLDLAMPRLGGSEFRRAQLGDPRVAGVPIAVMSGAIDLEARALAMGAAAIVAKPIDFDELVAIVQRLLLVDGNGLRVPSDSLTNRGSHNRA